MYRLASVCAGAALIAGIGVANAGEPIVLGAAALDNVTAAGSLSVKAGSYQSASASAFAAGGSSATATSSAKTGKSGAEASASAAATGADSVAYTDTAVKDKRWLKIKYSSCGCDRNGVKKSKGKKYGKRASRSKRSS